MGRRRYTIKQLPPELRPRERLLAEGPGALSSAELLGILFGFGSREKTAVELASEVISENGDLFGLYNAEDATPKTQNDLNSGSAPCSPRAVPSAWNWRERREP
jgi:DNA repair protein RadC